MTALFASQNYKAREISASRVAEVQGLYDENPDYSLAVHGRRPKPDAAQGQFDQRPPEHLSYTQCWFLGFYDRSGVLAGVAIVVSDLAAASVWHIAFFLIATSLHGTGAAAEAYAALEGWIVRGGAKWLRLGVVKGHRRAERFWEKLGFQEVRVREDETLRETPSILRVLVKPLSAAGLEEYLEAVPRDRKDSPLP